MNDIERSGYEMLVRVQDFGKMHSADFPATTLGAETFAIVTSSIADLSQHAGAQVSSATSAKQGTSSRELARTVLRQTMESFSLSGRAIAQDMPSISAKFPMPHNANDQQLLAAAEAFAADAEPLSAEFIRHDMPATFIVELRQDIATFRNTMEDQNEGRANHIASTASIGAALKKGITAVKRLEAIVRNKYSGNQPILAEWGSASHIERRTRKGPSEPQPGPAPVQATPTQ